VRFLLLYAALLAWQIDRWCFTPHGIVSTWQERASAVRVSAGSPGGVTQSFTMGADGFDGVWLRPRAVDGGAPRGLLVVDLETGQDGARRRVERVTVPAADAVKRSSLHVRFTPVRHSRGVPYAITIRHLQGDGGTAIDLAASRVDALRDGRLFADGREQWGDLVFETSSRRATLPYWMHEVLRPWPRWVATWPVVGGGLLAFNVLLAWACARATRGDARVNPEDEAVARPGAALPLAKAVLAACSVAGVVVAAVPTEPYRSLDLIDALPDARIETTWPSLHGGISPEPVVIFGRVYRSIVALPSSTIRWEVDVPRGAHVRFGAAMRPDVWDKVSDGIQMFVSIEADGVSTRVVEHTLAPMFVETHKNLHPSDVRLDPWAGKRVTIVFETTPERWGNAVNDVPVWVNPRIDWPRTPSAGVARVVR